MDDPLRRRSEDPAAASSAPRSPTRLERCGPPLALFLAAFVVRALPWPNVLGSGRVHFPDNDAYYHARRILYTVVRFPEFLSFDPYLNFPHGGEPIWSPLFDFGVAVLARFTVGAEPPALERLLAWIPPVLGAATVALTWMGTKAHFGRGAAWLAGGIVAVLPAHFLYSRIGFLDHHVAVALLGAALLFSGMGWLRRCAASPIPLRAALGLGLSSGVLVGGALLVWPGMILDVALFDAGYLALFVTRSRAGDARRVALAGALLHGLAALLVAPFALGREWQAWGPFTPVVLSSFQPWLLLGVAAFFAALAVALRRAEGSIAPARLLARVVVCGALVLGAAAFLLPDLQAPWRDVWRWFAKEERFQATVSESRPLLFFRPGRLGLGLAVTELSLLFLLAPVFLAAAAWRLRRPPPRPEGALLLGWTAVFLGASLVQLRFTNSLVVPFAVLVGWSGPPLVRELVQRVGGGPRSARLGGAVLLVVLLVPALASYATYLRSQWSWLRGRPPERGAREERKLLLVEVADWLREQTEPTSGWLDVRVRPEYAVLSHWTDGHILEYVARRPSVVDPFGDDLGEENFALSEEYYLAQEPQASEILDRLGARYAIFEYRVLPFRRDVGPRTILSRLYFADGAASDTAVAVRDFQARAVDLAVPGVERHRLVFETRPKPRTRRSAPAFKVYEHVRGALLTGSAEPGADVEARLALETNRGRSFEFISTTRADERGRFALRFPYSTQGTPPAVRPAARVELRSAAGAAKLVVREQDVREGRTVAVPPFDLP